MKKISLLIVILSVIVSTQTVKSLAYYINNEKTSFPVLNLDDGDNKLTIEFDVKSDFVPNLAILFRLCDINWNPVRSSLLDNIGKNTIFNLEYDFLPNTVKEANYHYKISVPDNFDYVEFPHDGKWKFFIVDYNDTTRVFAEGRFFVINETNPLKARMNREIVSGVLPENLAKTYTTEVFFNLPTSLFPNNLVQVEIYENFILNSPYIIKKDKSTKESFMNWDGNRRFTFTQKNMKPKNEYRVLDLSNANRYIGKDVIANLEGFDQSRFYRVAPSDKLNGAQVLSDFRNQTSEYLNVTFSLQPPNEDKFEVYLVGSFNNWQVSDNYKMTFDGKFFKKEIQLKRGIYNYFYVAKRNNELDWTYLEGNFFETKNIYHIFVFYLDNFLPDYYRIIGFDKINN